eukprot:Em0014g17a
MTYAVQNRATGKDGIGRRSYQVKVQPPIEFTDFAFEEQVANLEASWEIDSKASFQAPCDSTTNGTQTHSSSLHLLSLEQRFLCSVVHAATPAVTLTSKRIPWIVLATDLVKVTLAWIVLATDLVKVKFKQPQMIALTFALTRVRFSLPYRAAMAMDFGQFCLVPKREASYKGWRCGSCQMYNLALAQEEYSNLQVHRANLQLWLSHIYLTGLSHIYLTGLSHIYLTGSVSYLPHRAQSCIYLTGLSLVSTSQGTGLSRIYLTGLSRIYLTGLSHISLTGLSRIYLTGLSRIYLTGLSCIYLTGLSLISTSQGSLISTSQGSLVSTSQGSVLYLPHRAQSCIYLTGHRALSYLPHRALSYLPHRALSYLPHRAQSHISLTGLSLISPSQGSLVSTSQGSLVSTSQGSVSYLPHRALLYLPHRAQSRIYLKS